MREDLVTPATGRRLQRAGLRWEAQPGDWCVALGGEHYAEGQAGLWLVVTSAPEAGLLGVVDAAGQWPQVRVARGDCVWLPSSGKLKMWLRARGLRVATREAEGAGLGAGVRHLCRATAPGSAEPVADGQGPGEAEAVAAVVLHLLEGAPPAGAPDAPSRSGAAWTFAQASGQSGTTWTPLPRLPANGDEY